MGQWRLLIWLASFLVPFLLGTSLRRNNQANKVIRFYQRRDEVRHETEQMDDDELVNDGHW